MNLPRPFSFAQNALFGGLVNALINAPLGYAMVAAGESLPAWGLPGVAVDAVATAFGIAFGTDLVGGALLRRQVAAGKLAPAVVSPTLREGFARWPANALHRALNLGVLTVLLFTPVPLLLLWLLGVDGLDRTQMVWCKGCFAFVVGAVTTPVIAAAATLRASP